MSALRMVAYGVLDNIGSFPKPDFEDSDPLKEKRRERDQIRRLVREELKESDMLIMQAVAQKRGTGAYRSIPDKFILYGPRPENPNPRGWVTRGVIAEGDFRECCLKAVEFLEPFNQALSPHASDTE